MKILEQLSICIVPLDNDGFLVNAVAQFPRADDQESVANALGIINVAIPKQVEQSRVYAKDVEAVTLAVGDILKQAIVKANQAGK